MRVFSPFEVGRMSSINSISQTKNHKTLRTSFFQLTRIGSPKWRSLTVPILTPWKGHEKNPRKTKRRKSIFLRWLRTKKWRWWAVDTWIPWWYRHPRCVLFFCCDYLDRGRAPPPRNSNFGLQPWGCNPLEILKNGSCHSQHPGVVVSNGSCSSIPIAWGIWQKISFRWVGSTTTHPKNRCWILHWSTGDTGTEEWRLLRVGQVLFSPWSGIISANILFWKCTTI